MFFTYRWPDIMKELSGSTKIHIGWKYYQGFIHNTYHGDHIETDHHAILLMTKDVAIL